MITVENEPGFTRVTFPRDEVPPDRLNAMLDWLRQPQTDRVTSVEPLPVEVWRRIYAQPDEFASISAEQLAASQVREEPQ